MIITPVKYLDFNKFQVPQHIKQLHSKTENGYDALPLYSYPIFKSSWVKQSALAKEMIKERAARGNLKNIDIFKLDLAKLEGIQEGIKVFEGLSLKEIALMLTTMSEVATVRGCRNNCAHCYADAKPPIKETEEQINKMSWEDFKTLTGGIKELNRRLGFKISGEKIITEDRYLVPFHDSDGTDVILKDKHGKEHDFIEIAEELYDAMGIELVFDTSGWNLSDKKAQQRAEKYVEYYSSNSNNMEPILEMNISLNPFHSLYKTSVDLREKGEDEKSQKLRDLYTTRMANAFYTFTPFFKNAKFSILKTSVRDGEKFKDFNVNSINELFDEILIKLRRMYKNDLETEQKYVSSKKEIESILKILKNKYKMQPTRTITYTEKAQKSFGATGVTAFDHFGVLNTDINEHEYFEHIDEYRFNYVGVIDANGNYYFTNYEHSIPTELSLNLSSKGKTTAPIRPYLSNVVLTKEKINDLWIRY